MRTVSLALVPILGAIIGYLFALKYDEAGKFWTKFLFWHEKIKTEIAFSQNSLPEILKSEDSDDKFLKAATGFIKEKSRIDKLKFLSEDENAFFIKYLKNLGTSDKRSQLDFLNSMEKDILRFSKSAEDKSKKCRPLFIKLGFLFGLIVFILVV